LGDRDLAEDVVQDTLMRAWQGLDRRSRQTGFRVWLFAIARNVALDALQRQRARVEVFGSFDELMASAADVSQQVGARLEMEDLWSDLRALPDRQREAVTLHEVFGLSFDQIAARGGSTAKAARQAAIDGRKGLTVALAGRNRPCGDVRRVLAASDQRRRRQGWVVAHLRGCPPCRCFDRDESAGAAGAGPDLGWPPNELLAFP
jgi:RNA polymerase sigma-70 factor (ECF subfamily)